MTKIYSVISETKYVCVCSLSRSHNWKSILCAYHLSVGIIMYERETPDIHRMHLTRRGQNCAIEYIDYNGIIIYYTSVCILTIFPTKRNIIPYSFCRHNIMVRLMSDTNCYRHSLHSGFFQMYLYYLNYYYKLENVYSLHYIYNIYSEVGNCMGARVNTTNQ